MATQPASGPALRDVLRGLMSPDNTVRGQAENYFQAALQRQPGAVASELLQFLRSPANDAEGEVHRAFSAVLLRRVVDPKSAHWNKMSQRDRKLVRVGLLVSFAAEPTPSVARKVCHAIAMASRSEVAWPELVPALADQARNENPIRRELAFFLAEKIADDAEDDAFATATAVALLPPCAAGLSDNLVAASAAAATAAMALLVAMRPERHGPRHAELVAPILEALRRALVAGDETAAVSILESMSRLATEAPKLFRPALENTSASLLSVAGAAASSLEFRTRSAAAEVLLTFCECMPAQARRCQPLATQLLPVLMEMATEVDEDQAAWVRDDKGNAALGGGGSAIAEEDDDEDGRYGVEAMYRCVQALQGKAALAVSMRIAPQALQSPDWRRRRAGLCLMAALADGAGEQFRPLAAPTAMAAASAARESGGGGGSPSPRVVHQAMTLLGRLVDEFPNEVFTNADATAGTVAAIATAVADTEACGKVRARAASAAINFAEAADKVDEGAPLPHLDAMLSALCACLRGPAPPAVAASVLEAVAAAAAAAGPSFDQYYDAFAPGLKAVVAGSAVSAARGNDPSASALLYSALKCVAAVGKVVEASRASADALVVMNVLATALRAAPGGGGLAANEAIPGVSAAGEFVAEHVAPACAGLGPLLGEEALAGWLPVVLPPLFAALDAQPDFSMEEVSAEEAETCESAAAAAGSDDEETTSVVVEVHGMGQRRLTLNTIAVERKHAAASCIQDLAIAAGQAFVPHAADAAPRLLAAMEFRFSGDVRASASLALGEVFCGVLAALKRSNGAGNIGAVSALLSASVDRLLKALQTEAQPESRTCISSALRDILRACQESGTDANATAAAAALPAAGGPPPPPLLQLPLPEAGATTHGLCVVAAAALERRQTFEAAMAGSENFDEDDAAGMAEELAPEEELSEHIIDCIGYLLKGHGPAFLPIFDAEVAPLYAPLLGTGVPPVTKGSKGKGKMRSNGKGATASGPTGLQMPAPALRWNAACTFIDAIEFCGPAAHKHIPVCLPAMAKALAPENNSTLQMAGAYGLQQVAKHAPAALLPVLLTVLPPLAALAAPQQAKGKKSSSSSSNSSSCSSDENARFVRENAAAALARICCEPTVLGPAVGQHRAHLLGLWAETLPFTVDESEARAAHSLLCDLVEHGDTALLGPDLAAAPKVIETMAKILEEAQTSSSNNNNNSGGLQSPTNPANNNSCGASDLVDVATAERMGRLLKQMRDSGSIPPLVMESAWKALSEGQQRAVQRAMTACCG